MWFDDFFVRPLVAPAAAQRLPLSDLPRHAMPIALALQLRFLFDVGFLCGGLMGASPSRPCNDEGGLDAPLRQPHRDPADLLDRPADHGAVWRALLFVFGGGMGFAR